MRSQMAMYNWWLHIMKGIDDFGDFNTNVEFKSIRQLQFLLHLRVKIVPIVNKLVQRDLLFHGHIN